MRAVVQRILETQMRGQIVIHCNSPGKLGTLVTLNLEQTCYSPRIMNVLELVFGLSCGFTPSTKQAVKRDWSSSKGNFITSTIALGLCISVSFNKNDSIEDLNYMIKKVLNLKMFNDNLSNKPWKMNLKQKGYGVTVLKEKSFISGFNSSRPLFTDAMDSRSAHKFYKMFIKMLRQKHDPTLVKGTSFRKPVIVNVIHDGPTIFVLHSPSNIKRSPRDKFIAAYGLKYFVD